MNPEMLKWLGERVAHGAIYVVASVAIVMALYALFIRPTSKTVYTEPVTQNHTLENPKYAPFSCARIDLQK